MTAPTRNNDTPTPRSASADPPVRSPPSTNNPPKCHDHHTKTSMTQTRPTTTIMMLLLATTLLAAGIAHAQNVTSEPDRPTGEEGPQNLTLQGTFHDGDTNDPVLSVDLEIRNEWHDEDARGHDRIHQETDDGSFQANVSQGHIRLVAIAEGYERVHASFALDDDANLEVPMKPAGDEGSNLQGTILSDDGRPLTDANVQITPTRDATQDREGHHEHAIDVNGEDVPLRYDSQLDTHAWERTDEEGRFRAHLAAGTYEVRAHDPDHIRGHDQVTLDAGASHNVTLMLTSIPEASVQIHGTILDQGTGEPIPNAHITVVNDRWGQHERVYADANGEYQADATPGPLLVEARAGQYGTLPCEKAMDGAEPAYGDRCRIERDNAYLPRVTMLEASENETVSVDLELKEAPTPDATISGWVVNQTSEEGIEGATIQVRNEVTGDWGTATTDEHGSFTIPVHPGYYTVRAQHPDHPVAGINAEVSPGEEQRVTIEAPPGPVHDRHGMHPMPVYAEDDAHHTAVSAGGEAPRSQSTSDAGMEASDEASGTAGTQAYEGSEGGLGPYQEGEQPIPWFGALGTIALIGVGAAFGSRRSGRRG